jgi:hypothetical protein
MKEYISKRYQTIKNNLKEARSKVVKRFQNNVKRMDKNRNSGSGGKK